jgi:hypothetical protein
VARLPDPSLGVYDGAGCVSVLSGSWLRDITRFTP